jgi:hypothetical protein
MIRVQPRRHPLNKETRVYDEFLDIREHMLRPGQFLIVSDDHHALPCVRRRLHATLNEDLDAFAVIARAPRGISVQAVEHGTTGKGIQAVVEFRS